MAYHALVHKYEIVKWVVFLFLGTIVNTIALSVLIESYLSYNQQPKPSLPLDAVSFFLQQLGFAIGLYVIVPIASSILLTQYLPERRIVPPLYIQAISWAYIDVLAWFVYPRGDYGFFILGGLYIGLFLGMLQDKVVKKIVGITAPKELMQGYICHVFGDLVKVQRLLSKDEHRRQLNLLGKIETITDGERRFGSEDSYRYVMEVFSDPTVAGGKTGVRIVFYNKGRYSLRSDPELNTFAVKITGLFENLLRADKIEFQREKPELLEEQIDDLKIWVRTRLGGAAVHYKNFSRHDLIRFGVYVGLMVPIGIYLWYKSTTTSQEQYNQFDLALYGIIAAIGIFFATQILEWLKAQADKRVRR